MAAIEKVKVVVLGDSGVGKTSLTYLIAHNKPLVSPGWTVGCSVEVKLHRYKQGTQAQNTFFVELWDVGGSNGHRNTRNVFYQPTHGIILVHDLTNRKSQVNLQKWLTEILNQDNPTLQHVDVKNYFQVIERRYYSRVSPFSDKRRIPPYITATTTPLSGNRPGTQYMSPRFYHMD
ncbi:Small GTPase [Operophtera brumata]|uniref:Small GTPase n=1 Tax=Operophtera brumata TaxID=104452 RepID=A0A0L7LCY8_OPEBR|nr:Small GTPase [Operophtera brumata]